MLTAIQRYGGIAWSSWGDPRTRTYPGETAPEWRQRFPGVFRSRAGGGGMKWDELARALKVAGYGPQGGEGLEDSGAAESWFVDTMDGGEPRNTFPAVGEGAEDYELKRMADERWRQAKEQMESERAARRRGRRRANPSLMTLTNPAPTDALKAYREFHGRAPSGVRRLGGKGPTLIALGDLIEIVYQPTKGQRRGPAFVHKFGKGAVLAATPDGKELVLLPSPKAPFKVKWDRGIVG